VVNEVALNEIMPKGFMATTPVKNGWRNDQAATLYYVEAIDAGNPENKVDFREKYGNGKRLFDQNASFAKTKQRFSELFEMQLPIAFDEWYDTRKYKPIYSIRQMPLKIPK
jgi:hypothetical protein